MLSPTFDLSHPFHCLERRLDELAVVTNWYVSSFLEVDCCVLQKSQCSGNEDEESSEVLTMVISFPAALRNAFVHRTFRGFRFILKLH